MTSATTPLTPYRPRSFRFEGVVEAGAFRVKLYGIQSEGGAVPEPSLARARRRIEEVLPGEAAAVGDHHDLGFAILHAGQVADWLLIHWWAHADICCMRMAKADGSEGFTAIDAPYHACVWEGRVITHEHGAWMRTMLTEAPDASEYLAAVLPDGDY